MFIQGKKPIAMVVAANHQVEETLRRSLEKLNYQVKMARNGIELCSIIHADRPEIVLAESNAGWISGFDLCRAIKCNVHLKDTTILLIAQEGQDEEIEKATEAGANGTIPKPMKTGDLTEWIRDLTGKKRL